MKGDEDKERNDSATRIEVPSFNANFNCLSIKYLNRNFCLPTFILKSKILDEKMDRI